MIRGGFPYSHHLAGWVQFFNWKFDDHSVDVTLMSSLGSLTTSLYARPLTQRMPFDNWTTWQFGHDCHVAYVNSPSFDWQVSALHNDVTVKMLFDRTCRICKRKISFSAGERYTVSATIMCIFCAISGKFPRVLHHFSIINLSFPLTDSLFNCNTSIRGQQSYLTVSVSES